MKLLLLCSLFPLLVGCATRMQMKIPSGNLADTWVGIADSRMEYYRIALHADGRGVGAKVYPTNPPIALVVDSWKVVRGDGMKNDSVELQVTAKANPKYSFKMIGFAIGDLPLNLKVIGNGWQDTVHLRREHEFEANYRGLKAFAETLKAN